MKRSVTVITLTAALTGGLALPATTAGAPERTYVKYAKVRDKLKACALDARNDTLGPEKRRMCPRLRRRYTLYSFHGIPGTTFFRCKTRRCPRAPIGVPNPRGPVPARAVRIFG